MELLQYNELDPGRHRAAFERVCAALRAGDFRAAHVKKLTPGPYYRAELSAADRLIFAFGSCEGRACILLLEIVENHAYEKSRFLRGAQVDESRLTPVTAPPPASEPPPLTIARRAGERMHFHLLDKALSFDEEQEAALNAPLPLVLVGSAGSGKTALALERLKRCEGAVAYITLSPYLAEHASRLYHSFEYENPRQQADFLGFQEYLESIRAPAGRPVTFRAFAGWFARHRPAMSIKDAHMAFEEIRGVLTGACVDTPWLSREAYLALGVRRSIFLDRQREEMYALFEKYLRWLEEAGLYDPNIEAHRALPHARPTYDAVFVDEVQDLTNTQVQLALASLKDARAFLLTGDANQLVHPNFFSWSALHTMFYEQRLAGVGRITRLLCANYRNAPAVTALANRILRLKNQRFGSVDRESTMLSRSIVEGGGGVRLLAANDPAVRELDARTHRSARVAVVVLREEDKAAARAVFRTPLLFSVQEAKGLEYETVIAFGLIGAADREYRLIAEGVRPEDLADDRELEYARARDKSDKTAEALKFYINALYVTVTRAVRHVALIEARVDHPLLALLGITAADRPAEEIRAQASSDEEWRREARRLEMQGREEQAEAIRRTILSQQPPPWKVLTPKTLPELDAEAFDPERYNKQSKNLLFEYACLYDDWSRITRLVGHNYKRARRADEEREAVERKVYADYLPRITPMLREKLARHGLDFRNPFNQTPLMIAADLGQVDFAAELIRQGANPALRDNFGRTAFHYALRRACRSREYIERKLAAFWDLLAPESVNVRAAGRLRKFHRRSMEYLVFQLMFAILQDLFRRKITYATPGLQTGDIIRALKLFPASVLPPHRRKREAITAVLAGHEMFRPGRTSARVFLRLRRGYYVFNPDLEIEIGEDWVNVYSLIELDRLVEQGEHALAYLRERLQTAHRVFVELQPLVEQDPPVNAEVITRAIAERLDRLSGESEEAVPSDLVMTGDDEDGDDSPSSDAT